MPLPYRFPVAASGGSRRASSPAMTAASAEAISQYGLESDAPERNSIRDASGASSTSERTAALRLSRLQLTVSGAKVSGANRR